MRAPTQGDYWDAVVEAMKALPAPTIEPAAVRAELDRMRDDKRPAAERQRHLREVAQTIRATLNSVLEADPSLSAALDIEAFSRTEAHLLQMADELDRFAGRSLKALQRDRILLLWQKLGGSMTISNPWPKPPCGDAITFLTAAYRYVTDEDLTPDQAKDAIEQYRDRRRHGRKDKEVATLTGVAETRIDEAKITVIKAK